MVRRRAPKQEPEKPARKRTRSSAAESESADAFDFAEDLSVDGGAPSTSAAGRSHSAAAAAAASAASQSDGDDHSRASDAAPVEDVMDEEGGRRGADTTADDANDAAPMEVDGAPAAADDDASVGEHVLNLDDRELLELEVPPLPPPIMNSDGSGSRLIIEKIAVDNFKSYFGRHELGPFHKCFTSIVGPNGSGKSNVIDALQFVFGSRAARIRAKKVSRLIHNSEGRQNLDSCTVEVYFCKIIDKEGDAYEVVADTHFWVGRTANSDNSSSYVLNGRRANFKEVGTLLRRQGIDLDHNRFLILQGEVEQIALMKPKALTENDEGMLEYLEDIIGSSRFKEPIEMLSAKLDKLQEDRTGKLHDVKRAEQQKETWEGPKNEMLDFLELENRITHLESKQLQLSMAKIREKNEATYEERDVAVQREAALTASVEQCNQRLMTENGSLEASRAAKKKAEDKAQKLAKESNRMKEEDQRAKSDRTEAKKSKAEKEAELERAKKKLKAAQEKPASCAKKQEELRRQIAEHEQQLPEAEQRYAGGMEQLTVRSAEPRERKGRLENRLGGLKRATDAARAEMDVANKNLEMHNMEVQTEKRRLADLKTKVAECDQSTREKSRELEDLGQRLPAEELRLAERKRQAAAMIADEKRMTDELNAKVENVSVSRAKQMQNRSDIVKLLSNMQARGDLRGFYGRLGDLGAIDQTYDAAISSACPALDNMVVETIETAQACIAALKANGAGVATFIALEKQQHWRTSMTQPFDAPEHVPRLYDLVRCPDERFKPAFYFALRNALVAENIDQATRIGMGRGRHRVVTLCGKVIETSGTMSGGGKPRTGLMGRQAAASPSAVVSVDQLNRMEAEANRMSQALANITRDRQQLEEQIEASERQIVQWRGHLERLQLALRTIAEERKAAFRSQEDQEKVVKQKCEATDDRQAQKLRQAHSDAEAKFLEARANAQEVEKEVAEVEAEVEAIRKELVGDAEAKRNVLQKGIEDARARISKEAQGVNRAQREVDSQEEIIRGIEEAIELRDATIAKTRIKQEQLEPEFHEVEEKRVEAVEVVKELDEKMQAATAAARAAQADHSDASKKLQEIKVILAAIKAKLHEAERSIAEHEKQWAKLKLHDMERFRPYRGRGARRSAAPSAADDEGATAADDVEAAFDEAADVTLRKYSDEELLEEQEEAIRYALTVEHKKKSRLRPDRKALDKYIEKANEYDRQIGLLDALTELRAEHRNKYNAFRKQRLREFSDGFLLISGQLKEMYQTITIGGDAELEFADSLDPFSEGIKFSVRPPKKSWKEISNLSGGEKTLSSLALVFALHHFKPTPLYVMDEIDAALDFRNVSIIANYIKERTKNAQFIIISLRNNMFELANRLVGIYKTYDCTKHVVIDPDKIALGPAAPPSVADDAPPGQHVQAAG